MPSTTTPLSANSALSAFSFGSSMDSHGHVVDQKWKTTTLPRSSSSDCSLPSIVRQLRPFGSVSPRLIAFCSFAAGGGGGGGGGAGWAGGWGGVGSCATRQVAMASAATVIRVGCMEDRLVVVAE